MDKAKIARFVFAREEHPPLDRVLLAHLESGVLGNRYSEKTVARENILHIDLKDSPLILRHVGEILKELAE